jgi:hypothetical protein
MLVGREFFGNRRGITDLSLVADIVDVRRRNSGQCRSGDGRACQSVFIQLDFSSADFAMSVANEFVLKSTY